MEKAKVLKHEKYWTRAMATVTHYYEDNPFEIKKRKYYGVVNMTCFSGKQYPFQVAVSSFIWHVCIGSLQLPNGGGKISNFEEYCLGQKRVRAILPSNLVEQKWSATTDKRYYAAEEWTATTVNVLSGMIQEFQLKGILIPEGRSEVGPVVVIVSAEDQVNFNRFVTISCLLGVDLMLCSKSSLKAQ